jgi:hypothetical protein
MPLELKGRNPHDPIYVICDSRCQLIICLGCLAYVRPAHLIPIPLLLLHGREFLREHRFHKPLPFLPEGIVRSLMEERSREPGEE